MTNLSKKQDAFLKELLKDFKGDARNLFGKNGLIKEVSKRLIESALEGEITDHPGYEA